MLNGFGGGLRDRLASFGTDADAASDAQGESSMMPMTLVSMTVASVVTVLWVFGAWSALVPADGLTALPPAEMAAALAAVAAPPAVLWLALAVGFAASSARRSERAMRAVLHHTRRATEQSEVQVRTLLQIQEDARRTRMRDGLEEALADLRCSLALIAERTGLLSSDETELAWARTAAGDRWAFANAYLTPWAYQPELPEILGERIAEAPEAAAALQAYLRRWRRLLAVLSDSDADPLLRETLEDGPADRLHTFLLRAEKTAVALLSRREEHSGAGPAPHDAARNPEALADVAPPPPLSEAQGFAAAAPDDEEANAAVQVPRPVAPALFKGLSLRGAGAGAATG